MVHIDDNQSDEVTTGFQFDNYERNERLVQRGLPLPKAVKTGTTIAGLVFKDGVILGADTRATAGPVIADKKCLKLHYMQPNIYCAGAGTAADLEVTSQLIAGQLQLHRLNTGRQVQQLTAVTMLKRMLFRYQGHIGAALIVGGVDRNGPRLTSIAPHGSTQSGPYEVMGSGCLAAMSVFESRWRPNLEMDEAKQLVRDAIAAGIINDLMSGSQVDLCVITKDGATLLRDYDVVCSKGKRMGKYTIKSGATPVLTKVVRPIVVSETVKKTTTTEESMDTGSK